MPRFPDEGGAFSALTEGKRRGALTECVPAAPYPERAVRRGSEPHRLRPRLAVPRTPAVPVGCVLPANARVIEQRADRATPDARLPALARSAVPRYTQGQEAEIKERIRYGLPHHERPDLSGAPCAARGSRRSVRAVAEPQGYAPCAPGGMRRDGRQYDRRVPPGHRV